MKPGTTMLARMPKGPSSAASARTRPSNPDFAAVTAAVFGRPVMADCPPSAMMLQLFAVDARVEHEVRALGGEGQRDGATDVPAGAGDQRGLALETHPARILRKPLTRAVLTLASPTG